MTDYFFKDHELLVIQGEARLHGLERNNDAKTISPRLCEAKLACTSCSGLFLQRPSARRRSSSTSVPIRVLFRLYSAQPACAGFAGFTAFARECGCPHRGGFFGKPCVPFPVSGIRTPNSPFSPCGRRGQGDEGQKRIGMQKITHLSQEIYP